MPAIDSAPVRPVARLVATGVGGRIARLIVNWTEAQATFGEQDGDIAVAAAGIKTESGRNPGWLPRKIAEPDLQMRLRLAIEELERVSVSVGVQMRVIGSRQVGGTSLRIFRTENLPKTVIVAARQS